VAEGRVRGWWIAPTSGVVAIGVACLWVALYAYGRSQPETWTVEESVVVDAPIDEVWGLVGDPTRRAEWHPNVRAIARVEDQDGHPMWREIDPRGDRFDWVVLRRDAPHRLETATGDPEQTGVMSDWTWVLAEEHDGATQVTLTEHARIENPVWRGVYVLRYGPDATVRRELDALVAAFGDEG
jgi:uncharacterized protein YndB with AHSA1/START domain